MHSPGAQRMREIVEEPAPKPSETFRWGNVAIVFVVILGLAMLLLPMIGGSTCRRGKLMNDANNLKQLWTMQNNYMCQFGGRDRLMPPTTGSDFWLTPTRTNPPLIDSTLFDIFD